MRTKIGVLSDTHGLLRPEVKEALAGCDLILHGGDINRAEILRELEEIAPVKAVRGNNDKDWAENLPNELDLSLAGIRIFMTHKKKDLPKDLADFDLVITGHTHRYAQRQMKKTCFLNPGSCGPRRLDQPITLAIVLVHEGALLVQRLEIPHEKKLQIDLEKVQKPHVEKVMREIRKNRSVQEIASRTGMDEMLVREITRMVLTHPGVDADAVMTKLGL